jgi:hypothetical protein
MKQALNPDTDKDLSQAQNSDTLQIAAAIQPLVKPRTSIHHPDFASFSPEF